MIVFSISLFIVAFLLIILILYKIVYIFSGYKKCNEKVENNEEVPVEYFTFNEVIKSEQASNNVTITPVAVAVQSNTQQATATTTTPVLRTPKQITTKIQGPTIVVTSPQF